MLRTSNHNNIGGKVFENRTRSNRVVSVKEHSTAGGYVVLVALIVLVGILVVIAQNL